MQSPGASSVNQNCSDCGSSLAGPAEDRSRLITGAKGISVPEISLAVGQEIEIPIFASEPLNGLAVFSMEWLLDRRVQLLEVKEVLDEGTGVYSERREELNSVLHYNWFNTIDGGIEIKPGEALIYLRIRALEEIFSLKEAIRLLPFSVHNKLFYENG